MTVVKVVEDIAFGAHWPCQSIGRGLCAKVQTGGSPRASREPLVASADEPSVGPEKDRHFSQCGWVVGSRLNQQTRHSSLETLGPRLLPGRSGVAAAVARRVAVRDVADDDTRARREAREQPP